MTRTGITARLAWTAWLVALAVAAATLGLMIAPVLLEGTAAAWLAPHLRAGWSPFCHQEASRSLHLGGVQLLACARCTGIFAGGLAGTALAAPMGLVHGQRRIPRWLLFAGVTPMALDAGLGIIDVWEGTLATRAVTGGLAGGVTALLLVPGIVQVAQEVARLDPSSKRRAPPPHHPRATWPDLTRPTPPGGRDAP